MSSFVINVKLSNKHVIPVEVRNSETVSSLKQQLCQRQGLKPELVKIIFQGKQLHDTFILKDSDLGENSILHAVVKREHVTASSSCKAPSACSNIMLSVNPELTAKQSSTGEQNCIVNGCENGATDLEKSLSASSCHPIEHNATGSEARLANPEHKEQEESERVELALPQEPVSPHKQAHNLYFVYCKSYCHRLCPARIRVRCSTCKEGTMQLTQEPTCWQDVLKPHQIQGHCLSEGCAGDHAEFYFKCNGHVSSNDSQSDVVLPQISANLDQLPCLTCGDIGSPVMAFTCQRSHIMCTDCFIQYCDTKLNERQFVYTSQHGYTLGCPAGCQKSLIADGHYFRLLGEHQYERYQRFAAEECLLREGGVLCPAPGCGEGFFPENTRRIQCVRPVCQFVFCRDCQQPYHERGPCNRQNVSLDVNDKWLLERSVCDPHEEECISTIAKISKPCPQCKVPVERDGGCMHMYCSRCTFEWCWLCHVEWSRDCQASHWFG